MQNPVTCVRDLTPMHEYRIAVGKFDKQCLGLEEHIEDVLKKLQRWEAVHRQAVKMVLLQFHRMLSNLLRALEAPIERSASHIATYLPDLDLSALIERYRTGPFRPQPQVYESVAHDESDILSGIDLRRWSVGGWNSLHGETQNKPLVPPVLTASSHSMCFWVHLHASLATSGLWVRVRSSRTSGNPNPNVLSVRFRFGEALNLNWTERTVRVGSGSGSGIFPNWTDGPVWGLGKFTPEPDRTEPRQP